MATFGDFQQIAGFNVLERAESHSSSISSFTF
jgi:hypothetical protein